MDQGDLRDAKLPHSDSRVAQLPNSSCFQLLLRSSLVDTRSFLTLPLKRSCYGKPRPPLTSMAGTAPQLTYADILSSVQYLDITSVHYANLPEASEFDRLDVLSRTPERGLQKAVANSRM